MLKTHRVFSCLLPVPDDYKKGNKEVLMAGFFKVATGGDCTSGLFCGTYNHSHFAALRQSMRNIRRPPAENMNLFAIGEVSPCQM